MHEPAIPAIPDDGGAAAAARSSPRLLAGPEEARAFWRMRLRMLATTVRQMVFDGRLRLAMVLALSLLLWLGLFFLFYDAFKFLDTAVPTPDLYDQLVRRVFGLFFGALMLMLVLSSGIILYSALFRGRDVPFLLTLPARSERVFLSKFQEAIVMSSWAFILLGSPMLLAYGLVHDAPWYFFAMLIPYLVAFVYLPAGVGAMCCLAIVHRLPSGRSYVLAAAVLAVVAGGSLLAWSLVTGPQGNLLTPDWFQEMLNRLRITEYRMLPSWWLSTGLLQAARRDLREAGMFLVLLVSNALFFRQLAIWAAQRLYRPAYSRLHGRRVAKKRTGASWIDRVVTVPGHFLPRQVALLIVKDFRLFRRDPVQWSQFLIFFCLLSFYFVNIRSFNYDMYITGWVNAVSFLNVSVVGLLLSTFTTRFVFPMISLEGRRFWFLGLLPVGRNRILWSKFAFAVGCSIVPSSLLIVLSDVMLRVDSMILASHQLTCLVLCLGLAGIAVGLGARMPNLREESPSRIAAGFGGTLALVLSTLYIMAVVLLTAVPCHFYVGGTSSYFGDPARFQQWIEWWLAAGTIGSVVLGAVATVLPMALGFRAFRRQEF